MPPPAYKGRLAAQFRQLIRATWTDAELDHVRAIEQYAMLPGAWRGRADVRDPAARATP